MNHCAADAAVADEQIRAAADDADGDAALAAGSDDLVQSRRSVRGSIQYCAGPPMRHGRVEGHRFVELHHCRRRSRSMMCLQFLGHLEIRARQRADLVDIARAERDEQVAGPEEIAGARSRGGFVSVGVRACTPSALALRADFLEDRLAADARQRLLARGIDVGDEQRVRIDRRRAELLLQQLRARVAMRLEEADDAAPAFRSTAVRSQRGRDLRRMMAVVVDRPCKRAPWRLHLKTPPGTAEAAAGRTLIFSKARRGRVASAMAASAFETLCRPGMSSVTVAERFACSEAPSKSDCVGPQLLMSAQKSHVATPAIADAVLAALAQLACASGSSAQ